MLMSLVKKDLKGLLQTNVLSVSFMKVNNTLRTMQCTLNANYLPPQLQDNKDTVSKRVEPDNLISVWDIENNGWRSFRIDSIIDYSIITNK